LESREHISENRAYIPVNSELEGNATVFTIDEDKLRRCPHIKLMIGEQEVVALVDSGAESWIISQELFESLINKGIPILHMPVIGCVLTSAFGRNLKRIKKQALIEFTLNEHKYEVMALVAPELATSVIIGTDFINEYRVKLDFTNNHFETQLGGIIRKYKFYRGPAEVVGIFDNTINPQAEGELHSIPVRDAQSEMSPYECDNSDVMRE
jgi:predicted aspartyl protease